MAADQWWTFGVVAKSNDCQLDAIVQVVRSEIGAGFGDSGTRWAEARIEFEGRLRAFLGFPRVDSQLTRATRTVLTIDVEFTNYGDEEPPYIGEIQLLESSTKDVQYEANLKLTLPLDVLNHFHDLRDRQLTFRAIGDVIEEPDEVQAGDHIVALVKRVYFKTALGDEI